MIGYEPQRQGREVVLSSETIKLAKEFDPSRPGVPETVAAAQAASTQRRIFRVGRFPLWRPDRGTTMKPTKRVVMEAIYPCVGGLDVHQATVMACRRRLISQGQVEVEVKQFGTTTSQLGALARVAGAVGGDARGDGVDGGAVAAGLERAGRDVPIDAGQCPAPEESAGTQDRCHGCRVDCAVSAMRVAALKLCATGASEAVAASDPAADEAVGYSHSGGQPDTQGAGAGQHQGVVGGLRFDGRQRASDVASDGGGRKRPGPAGGVGAGAGGERSEPHWRKVWRGG